MLRKITQGAGNINFERTLASTSSQRFPVASWLDTQHDQSTRRFASTRTSPQQRAEDPSKLPRFMRRQLLQQNGSTSEASVNATKVNDSKRSNKSIALSQSNQKAGFRSRHYDPSKEKKPKEELKLLEPHVLSQRIKDLCDAGKIDDAITMLKNAPLDAQNTAVWNTLIWEALKAKRFQMAYLLYVDMKRRGFAPTTRTYQTFFTGLSRIEHWSSYPKQLENARTLYQNLRKHLESVQRHDPTDPELYVAPIAGYIRILGGSGYYQELFDVFYSLDKDGPLAPDHIIFTAMFEAINRSLGDTPEGSVKVAADARLLWGQFVKAAKKHPNKIVIDAHSVVSAVKALSGGNKPDHELAFKLLSQYFGLDADKVIPSPGEFVLTPEALAAALRLCNRSGNYAACRQFFQQVKRRPEETGGISIVDRAHMEDVLKAELALKEPGLGYHAVDTLEWMLREEIKGSSGPKIRPALSTYNLVMQACRYSADWNSATRTFDLMTGYHAHDFMDGSVAAVPRFDKRGPGRSFKSTPDFISSMLKTALATKNRADMRQALRIIDHLGFENIMTAGTPDNLNATKLIKYRSFHGRKLASSIAETVDAVLVENGKYAKPEEAKRWRALAKTSNEYVGNPASGTPAPSKTPSKAKGRRT
ncbi:hypothetical protein CPC08DRAFT_279478 [Agrocybe pediades]|nr:hypothetical protein CPC08DRAFT_279478 [Agrocybe pediades]